MPITKGAKKAVRSSAHKRIYNVRRKDDMNDAIKKVRKLIIDGNKDAAQELISTTNKAIDKAVKRGVIKKNTAARKKSRLVASIKKIQ